MPTFYVIPKGTPAHADLASVETWLRGKDETSATPNKPRNPDDYIVITGKAERPQFTLKLAPVDAEKREKAPAVDKEAADGEVAKFLRSLAADATATLEEVATGAHLDKQAATASLQRLKKAGKVHSPGRNKWAAKATGEAQT